MRLDEGWYTAPDGSVNRIIYPHGIHGGAIVQTMPTERVWDWKEGNELRPNERDDETGQERPTHEGR
jgi:hypothetical protein